MPGGAQARRISYEEMLELACLGAKVLQIRSVEFAMKYQVPLWVKSSFSENPGTLVCAEDGAMEEIVVQWDRLRPERGKIVTLRASRTSRAWPRTSSERSRPPYRRGHDRPDGSREGRTDLTFTVDKPDLVAAREVMASLVGELGITSVESDGQIAKVSIVGVGMRNHAGVAARMFHVLAAEGINIQMISTSEIKVSCVVDEKYTELAVRSLHTEFGLDAAASQGIRG